jgi:hypothetical protein
MGGFANYFGSAEQAPFSYEKQRTEEESTTKPDPLTLEQNQLKADQIAAILKATGGYGTLFGPESDKLFQLTGQSRNLLNRYIGQAAQPGLTPEQWYREAKAAIDPTTQIDAAQNLFKNIVAPQLTNRYAAMGLGRSGAMGEGLAVAGSQIALPIASELQRQRFELERQRPNLDVTLRAANLQRLQQGFAASDVQRQLDVANWQRKVTGTASAMSMVPYVAGQEFKGTSRQFGNLMWDLLQTAIGVVSAIYGGGNYQDPTKTTPADIGGNAPLGGYNPSGAPGQGPGSPTGGGGGGYGGYGAPGIPTTSAPAYYNTAGYNFGTPPGFGGGGYMG